MIDYHFRDCIYNVRWRLGRVFGDFDLLTRRLVKAFLAIKVAVLVVVIEVVARNSAQLLPVAEQNLRLEAVLASAAEADRLHQPIDVLCEQIVELGAPLVDARSLLVVEPCVLKH